MNEDKMASNPCAKAPCFSEALEKRFESMNVLNKSAISPVFARCNRESERPHVRQIIGDHSQRNASTAGDVDERCHSRHSNRFLDNISH
jgi:hypothetical protein